MLKKIIFFIIISIYISFTQNLYSNIENSDNLNRETKELNNEKIKIDPSKLIIKHIIDSHEWHLFGSGKKSIVISLPIILWDEGFKVFMSNNFNNKGNFQHKSGSYYKIFNDKIYKTNSNYNLYFTKINEPSNKKPLDISITKNVFLILFSSFLMIIIFIKLSLSYNSNNYVKYKYGILIESLILFIIKEISIPNIGLNKHEKYLPFLLTTFFFILINNLLGLLPCAPNITGNINITFVLSLMTFLITNLNGNIEYWKHIFWMPNIPIGIRFLLAPIELISIFVRPLTLCIRLFANMTAGHIIILSFICLIFIFKNILSTIIFIPFALFISLLEILVAFLQAFIFTNLSALFIGLAVKNEKKES